MEVNTKILYLEIRNARLNLNLLHTRAEVKIANTIEDLNDRAKGVEDDGREKAKIMNKVVTTQNHLSSIERDRSLKRGQRKILLGKFGRES